jgi:hypothetical protein
MAKAPFFWTTLSKSSSESSILHGFNRVLGRIFLRPNWRQVEDCHQVKSCADLCWQCWEDNATKISVYERVEVGGSPVQCMVEVLKTTFRLWTYEHIWTYHPLIVTTWGCKHGIGWILRRHT